MSVKRRLKKLEQASGGGDAFNLLAHLCASDDFDSAKAQARGYDDEQKKKYSEWRMDWSNKVVEYCGNKKNHLLGMFDPFLWEEFDRVWDDSFFHSTDMEIEDFLDKRAEGFTKTWSERVKNMKGVNFVGKKYFDRAEQLRKGYDEYLRKRDHLRANEK